jgi:hypothetical protein
MFTQLLTERNAAQLYCMTIGLLGLRGRSINTATDEHGDVVRITGSRRCTEIPTLADQVMHEGAGERKHACIYMV